MKNWDKPQSTKSKKAPKWSTKYGQKSEYSSKGCGYSNDHSFEDTAEKFLEHNGIERSYIVHLPPSYNHGSDEGHPIILSLHGSSMTALETMERSLMNEHADANNYIAVYPQGTILGYYPLEFEGQQYMRPLATWNDLGIVGSPSANGPTCARPLPSYALDLTPAECRDIYGCNAANCNADDIGFIEALLDELEDTYCIDRSRIYMTGFSNGGFLTQKMGCELNHRLAAIAPQHGQSFLGYNCEPKYDEPMPIINIWGTNDKTVPGEAILSENLGAYMTPVSHVQYKYGKHNKCNVDEQLPQPIATASDGILEWQCIGYNECDRGDGEYGVDVMSCSWNGAHVEPVTDGEPFGLNVIWDFFKKYTQIPPVDRRKNL